MHEDDKLRLAGIAAGDQWDAVKDDLLADAPCAVIGLLFSGFDQALRGYERLPVNTPELLASMIVRCAVHREMNRRIEAGTATLESFMVKT